MSNMANCDVITMSGRCKPRIADLMCLTVKGWGGYFGVVGKLFAGLSKRFLQGSKFWFGVGKFVWRVFNHIFTNPNPYNMHKLLKVSSQKSITWCSWGAASTNNLVCEPHVLFNTRRSVFEPRHSTARFLFSFVTFLFCFELDEFCTRS